MQIMSSTIRELLVEAEKTYGSWDAFRYKVKKKDGEGKKAVEVESKTYTELKNDAERFSFVLEALGEQKSRY